MWQKGVQRPALDHLVPYRPARALCSQAHTPMTRLERAIVSFKKKYEDPKAPENENFSENLSPSSRSSRRLLCSFLERRERWCTPPCSFPCVEHDASLLLVWRWLR